MNQNDKEILNFIDKSIAVLDVLKSNICMRSPDYAPSAENSSSKNVHETDLIKNIPIAMGLIDSNGSIKNCNKAFQTALNLSPKSSCHNIKEIIKSDDLSALLDSITNGLSAGAEFRYEINAEKAHRLLLLPLQSMNKELEILCLIETIENIDGKYKLLVEKANDGIIIIQDGFLKFFNQKVISTTGYNAEELYRRPFLDNVHAADMARVFEKHQERLAGKELEHIYPIRVLTKSGAEIWTEVNAVPITWNDKPAVLGIIRDLTIQRKLEEELAQARKMESLGTLAGGIAHNFNNILSAIIGYTELGLVDSETSPKELYRHEQVLKSATRAKEMIKKILIFAMKNMEEKKRVHLSGILISSIERIKEIKPDNVVIESTINRPCHDIIIASSEQIEEAIYQILKNSINSFVGNQGRIFTRFEQVQASMIETTSMILNPAERYIMLSIEDNGCGMPKDILSRIFEPYFTTMDTGKGIGLGLPFVHGIIKSHNGFVNVKSNPGMGSIFTIYLPVVD